MKRMLRRLICAVALAAGLPAMALADPDMRYRTVHFGGWTGYTTDGHIEGREADIYEFRGVRGQKLAIRMHSPNSSTYFNVYGPHSGPGGEALANGSIVSEYVPNTNEFAGVLPETGTYKVSVYLFRAAAREGQRSEYTIEFDLVDTSLPTDPAAAVLQVRTHNANGHLNVHTGPSLDAPRVGRYANGALLRKVGPCHEDASREWCEVMAYHGGLAGFVAREYLAAVYAQHRIGMTHAREAQVTRRATPTVRHFVSSSSEHFHVHLSNPSGHLNVHSSPSVEAPLVGRFPDGADLRNVGGCTVRDQQYWCEIMAAGGGVSGWVVANYLRDGHPPAEHVTRAAITRSPAESTHSEAMPPVSAEYWKVDVYRSGSSLRVHAGPSTRSPIVGRFHDGATLRNADGCLVNEGRSWCHVRSVSGAVSGWAAGEFLKAGMAPGLATHVTAPTPEPAATGPRYDMTGSIACVHDRDAGDQQCSFGAVHEGNGNGYLQITQDGFGMRAISFEHGRPVYFDKSQADGNMEMRVSRDGDDWIVFIGEARFVIPVGLFEGEESGEVATQLPLSDTEEAAENSGDATVPGTEFSATAQVSCTRDRDAADETCDAGVVRDGDGSGYVMISWPDGGGRAIFFEDNTPVRFDWSQADGDAEMTVNREADEFVVFIGEARFVIPEVLIVGD